MPDPKSPTLTAARAARHEALYPRLAALRKQVETVAGKKPELAVPLSTCRAARQLLDAARLLLGPGEPTRQLRLPAPDPVPYAGLAAVLAEAALALETFEQKYSGFHPRQQCVVWRLSDGAPRPVPRLLPPGAPPPDPAQVAETARMRASIFRQMFAHRSDAYEQGYADALAGRPNREAPGPDGQPGPDSFDARGRAAFKSLQRP